MKVIFSANLRLEFLAKGEPEPMKLVIDAIDDSPWGLNESVDARDISKVLMRSKNYPGNDDPMAGLKTFDHLGDCCGPPLERDYGVEVELFELDSEIDVLTAMEYRVIDMVDKADALLHLYSTHPDDYEQVDLSPVSISMDKGLKIYAFPLDPEKYKDFKVRKEANL